MDSPLASLVSLLQHAYSGELAAALAYRGHSRSVADAGERERIARIEQEEWHHRLLVGGMLRDLGGAPRRLREVRAWIIGASLGVLCHLVGWFLPMYAAGRLESRNVVEYEDAARFARDSGNVRYVDCLLTMSEVEWDHEAYFRGKVAGHPMLRYLSLWPEIPPKDTIRGRMAAESERNLL